MYSPTSTAHVLLSTEILTRVLFSVLGLPFASDIVHLANKTPNSTKALVQFFFFRWRQIRFCCKYNTLVWFSFFTCSSHSQIYPALVSGWSRLQTPPSTVSVCPQSYFIAKDASIVYSFKPHQRQWMLFLFLSGGRLAAPSTHQILLSRLLSILRFRNCRGEQVDARSARCVCLFVCPWCCDLESFCQTVGSTKWARCKGTAGELRLCLIHLVNYVPFSARTPQLVRLSIDWLPL